jgi:hypothetical protein
MSLDRWYRLLLRAYPRWHRRERGTELLTTLLDAAPPDRRRPAALDVLDLLRGGLRCRIRPPRGAMYRLVTVTAALFAALAGAAVAGPLSSYSGPPRDADAIAAAEGTMGALPAGAARSVAVSDSAFDHTDFVRFDYVGLPGDPGAAVRAALDRLTARGWRVTEPLRRQEDNWGPCDAPTCATPMVYHSFAATRGGVAVTVTGAAVRGQAATDPARATGIEPRVSVTVTKTLAAGAVLTVGGGAVAGLAVGWLLAVWAVQRHRRHRAGRRRVLLVAGVPGLFIGALFVLAFGNLVVGLSLSGGWTPKGVMAPAFVLTAFPTVTALVALSAALTLALAALPGSAGRADPHPADPRDTAPAG